MSVIIRLQNLPWSANALDIRQFFRGLSIPEGGVHIVGGERGDAFIAFSTDEDARQAMMQDREAINGTQIRLLLSSRAEMQKVIETARQQSLLALKNASGAVLTQPKPSPPYVTAVNVKKTVATIAPQPPVITASSFQNLLSNSAAAVTPSFLAYQQQAGFTLIPDTKSNTKIGNDSDDSESHHSRERRRSGSRERRRSKSRSRERSIFRRRRDRSRDRSRERDWPNGKRSSRHRSRSREKSRARSRDRERSRNNNRDSSRRNSRDNTNIRPRSMDADSKSKSNLTPWSTTTNVYQASYNTTETGQNSFIKMSNYQANTSDMKKSLGNDSKSMDLKTNTKAGVAVTAVSTNFQNYNIATQSLTSLNNYSLSGILSTGIVNDPFKGFALQNPYTTALKASANNQQESVPNTTSSSAIPGIFVEKKCAETNVQAEAIDSGNSLPQEPIAFANVNPYEQMYPNLFAQAAALSSGQKSLATKQTSISMTTDSPTGEETKSKDLLDPNETNCVRIANMCSRTTYSDLRKFFVGLFIPHNGIKMLNDKHGLRVGIAYVQFSRQSSVAKALCRTKNLLKGKSVIIEAVSEQEFIRAEDSFRPLNQDKDYSHRGNDSDNDNTEGGLHGNSNSGFSALNPYKKIIQLEPFTVLYIEDIPSLATEQDIMKMFSSYSLYDILLIASPENRREFVAYVRFSREEDAKSAYEDRAHHQIGYRRVRIRISSIEEMENAKEKIRLANEQLIKEEQAAEEEETKRKLEKLITDHITQEENKQQNVSMELSQEDPDDEADDDDDGDDDDVIETTDDLQNNTNDDDENDIENVEIYDQRANEENSNNYNLHQNDMYSQQNQVVNKFNTNLDPRQPQTPNIPSIFDLDPMNSTKLLQNQNRPNIYNDPRLRNMSERAAPSGNLVDSNQVKNNQAMTGGNNFNNFNSNFNHQQQIMNPTVVVVNNIENNFVILKNCEYNTRINDVAQLLVTANLALKHIEPLRNERLLPTGEFIVEFRRNSDAEIAVQRFHNIPFRNRSLRVFPITPQEIADRLGKPFLSYVPGGNGIKISKGMANDSLMRNSLNATNNPMNTNNNRFGNNAQQSFHRNPFSDNGPNNIDDNNSNNNNGRHNILQNTGNTGNNGGNGIPDKFTRPGCVLSLENVPYKAQLSDILHFFQDFDLTPDDIIRRFNDDGSPTGDARVAFMSPEDAKAAFESRKRKKFFGRAIFIKPII